MNVLVVGSPDSGKKTWMSSVCNRSFHVKDGFFQGMALVVKESSVSQFYLYYCTSVDKDWTKLPKIQGVLIFFNNTGDKKIYEKVMKMYGSIPTGFVQCRSDLGRETELIDLKENEKCFHISNVNHKNIYEPLQWLQSFEKKDFSKIEETEECEEIRFFVIGEKGSGKTFWINKVSLLYSKRRYSDVYKVIPTKENEVATFIHDVHDLTIFDSVRADGVIIFYAENRPDHSYKQTVYTTQKNVPTLFVQNKKDLGKEFIRPLYTNYENCLHISSLDVNEIHAPLEYFQKKKIQKGWDFRTPLFDKQKILDLQKASASLTLKLMQAKKENQKKKMESKEIQTNNSQDHKEDIDLQISKDSREEKTFDVKDSQDSEKEKK